jgi:hypothetical protein
LRRPHYLHSIQRSVLMTTPTLSLLERCNTYIREYAGVHLRAQLLKDLEAAIAAERNEQAKPQQENFDKLAALGWQAVECSICGSHAMAYPQPLSGALIVHKGCKTTWANGVIEVHPDTPTE